MAKSILENQESLVKKASYLRIAAADLAENLKNGSFKSLYHGQGIEFSGVRDYIRGDDIRAIDWNVTARMGKPFVKVFEEDRELELFIILDSSESMKIKGSGRTKFSSAAESAALISIACELGGCPVGAVFFDGQIQFSSRPLQGREQTMMLLTHLDKLGKNCVNGSMLDGALNGAGKLLNRRSLIFVFSDFRSALWEKPLISLAQKNDVVAVRLQSPEDEELPFSGDIRFKDVESGLKMRLPVSTSRFKKAWKDFNEQNVNRWQEVCYKHGVMPVVLSTQDEPLQMLSSVFARNGRR